MYTRSCYLCKSLIFKKICKVFNYTINRCSNCGFIFVFPLPKKEILERFYSSFDYRVPILQEVIIRKDAIRSLKLIKKYVYDRKISLFDIACGRGYFIDEARKLGWKAYGIDYSKNAIKYAYEKLNLDVERANINSYTCLRTYDIITINQFIEHVSNPNDVIRNSFNLLKKHGLIYIATPNIDSISAKVLGLQFDHLIPPEHLGYFSKRTLSRLVTSNRFKVLYIGTWSYKEDLAGIIKKIVRGRLNITLTQNLNVSLKQNNNFIKKIKYLLFDQIFCNVFYRFLNIKSMGSVLEILAIKE